MPKRDYQTGLEISDRKWEKLAPLLPTPPRPPKGGQEPTPNRTCFEVILWLM